MENQQEEKQFTPEEVETMRKNMINHYKKENAVLKLQVENSKYLAEVEEYKLRKLKAMYETSSFFAQMEALEKQHANEVNKSQPKSQPVKEPTIGKKRTLKKETNGTK